MSISADGTRVAIGANRNDGPALPDVGHVRVFDIFDLSVDVGADFNGDGFDDVVLTDRNDSPISPDDEGAVQVLYGATTGIDPTGPRTVLTQGGDAEPGDAFGTTWAAGDFNNDGFDDLAVTSGGENALAGRIDVFDGSPAGLPTTPTLTLQQGQGGVNGNQSFLDGFGQALAVGDFDSDGFDDLAVGVPGEDFGGHSNAGQIHIFNGTQFGLDPANDTVITQDDASQETAETGDSFGSALASADFNADGYDDLAVGVPGESFFAGANEGVVHAFRGSPTGISLTGDVFFNQGTPNVDGGPETGDRFGQRLAASTFLPNGIPPAVGYLVVGVTDEFIGAVADAGIVHYFPGNTDPNGPLFDFSQEDSFDQNQLGVEGTAEPNEQLGQVVVAGPIAGPNNQIGVIAGVSEDLTTTDAGAFHAVPIGTNNQFDFTADALVDQGDLAVPDDIRSDDEFATIDATLSSINIGDYNGDGYADLHVIANGEDIDNEEAPGQSHVMYGSATLSPWDDPNQITIIHHPGVTATCNGLAVTVDIADGDVPTAGDDVILGTPGDDVIVASTGDDTICGEGGDDTINAGPGNDWVDAGDGADTVFGLDGNDTIFGGDGNDQVVAGNNNDTIFGGDGTDTLNGGPGNDTLNGEGARDFLFAQGGDDSVNGGDGNDLILGVDGIDTINAGSGDDVVNAGPGNDTVNGGDGDDTILGLGLSLIHI